MLLGLYSFLCASKSSAKLQRLKSLAKGVLTENFAQKNPRKPLGNGLTNHKGVGHADWAFWKAGQELIFIHMGEKKHCSYEMHIVNTTTHKVFLL